jgi:hypothetical protein
MSGTTVTDLETTALNGLLPNAPKADAAVRELARRADEPRTEQEHRWRNEVRRCQHERDAAEADRDRLQAALAVYANEESWDDVTRRSDDFATFEWCGDDGHELPWKLARAALDRNTTTTQEAKP